MCIFRVSALNGSAATRIRMNEVSPRSVGSYRWVICALLFFATTINYVDRSVFGVLEPTLREKIGWTATEFGDINANFNLAYAIGFLFAGWMIDKLGHESGIRFRWSCGRWPPRPTRLRATAASLPRRDLRWASANRAIFRRPSRPSPNGFRGRNGPLPPVFSTPAPMSGAIIAPVVVPIIALRWGWEWAFIGTGLAGLLWVFFWWPIYRRPQEHPTALRRANWRTSKATRPIRRSKSAGSSCCRFGRRGRSPSASFSRMQSGGSMCFGSGSS